MEQVHQYSKILWSLAMKEDHTKCYDTLYITVNIKGSVWDLLSYTIDVESIDSYHIQRIYVLLVEKALRMLCGLHPMTHCNLLAGLSNPKPLDVQLK